MQPTRSGKLFVEVARRRKPRVHDLRAVYNAVCYQTKNAVVWRDLPADFPPWWAVYQQFSRWAGSGALRAATESLRRQVRVAAGREADPSMVILDSQTVKSTPESGQHAGFDGGKKGARAEASGVALVLTRRPSGREGEPFVLMPRRWVIERTFAWLSRHRRLDRSRERRPYMHMAFIHIAFMGIRCTD